jgi:hypothetical protein
MISGSEMKARTVCTTYESREALHGVMSNSCMDPRTEMLWRLAQVTSVVLRTAWKYIRRPQGREQRVAAVSDLIQEGVGL